MPKNPLKGFARRKSSGNVLDSQPDPPEQPVQSSFRVLERPNKTTPDGVDRRTVSGRPLSTLPFHQSKGKSTEDLGGSTNRSVNIETQTARPNFWGLKRGRGSGTTTLSGSSGYYDTSSSSARYSSSSTLPSSLDQEQEAAQDDLFPAKPAQTHHDQSHATPGANNPNPPQSQYSNSFHNPNPSFSSRASKAMSFGLKSKKPDSQVGIMTEEPVDRVPTLPDLPNNAAIRDRATTVSSYASTAVPPRLEANLGTSEFGSDFGNMFEGLADSKKETPLPPPPRAHGGYLRSVRSK